MVFQFYCSVLLTGSPPYSFWYCQAVKHLPYVERHKGSEHGWTKLILSGFKHDGKELPGDFNSGQLVYSEGVRDNYVFETHEV